MEILTTIYGIAALGSWLLAIIEAIAMWLFLPFLFRVGVRVKTVQGVDINLDCFEIGREYETDHAKFKRISENSCLFRERHRYFFFRVNTPFPVKGEILRRESGLFLIWRVPLGTSLFLTLWLIPWLIGGMLSVFHLDVAEGLFSLAIGIGAILFMAIISVGVEGGRARTALSEIKMLSETKEPPLRNMSPLLYKSKFLENSSENFSREIAKSHLQNGEHIIKTFIGQEHVSSYLQNSSFSANWYCVTLTQSMLVLIELDSSQNPLSVKRIPNSSVNSANFEKGQLNIDKITLDFGTDGVLELDVEHSLRNQTQALCSVFNHA